MSAGPGQAKMVLTHNADESFPVTRQRSGAVLNISAFSYTAQLRTTKDGTGSPLLTFTCTITDGTNGVVTLSLTAAQTGTLTPGTTYFADLKETAAGLVTVPVQWSVTVMQEVTK